MRIMVVYLSITLLRPSELLHVIPIPIKTPLKEDIQTHTPGLWTRKVNMHRREAKWPDSR